MDAAAPQVKLFVFVAVMCPSFNSRVPFTITGALRRTASAGVELFIVRLLKVVALPLIC